MSLWLISTTPLNNNNATTVAQGVTAFFPIGGTGNLSTEAGTQLKMRGTFTGKNLSCYISAINGTTTVVDRKNGANGGMSISITTTGLKEDASGTTALASNDLYNISCATGGSHTNTTTFSIYAVSLDDGGANIAMWQSGLLSGGGFYSGGTAWNIWLSAGTGSTSAACEQKLYVAGTFSFFTINFNTNTINGTQTYRTRKNGANANGVLSVAASSTGLKEDTTNSDTVSANDTFGSNTDGGGSSGSAAITNQIKWAATSDPVFQTGNVPANQNAGQTNYSPFFGYYPLEATETASPMKARMVQTWKNIQAFFLANSSNGTSTLDLRANGASQAPSLSVLSGVTGRIENNSTYTSATTDTMNLRQALGGSSGSLTYLMAIDQGTAAAPAVVMPELVTEPYVPRGYTQFWRD